MNLGTRWRGNPLLIRCTPINIHGRKNRNSNVEEKEAE